MDAGGFYYLTDKYFDDFMDSGLMRNKETVDGLPHSRPCFFAFEDKRTGLLWMIPISSKVGKYEAIYQHKVSRTGRCDTIVFGNVLGHRKAFLIQNMCPATKEYIEKQYMDAATFLPVRIDRRAEKELISKARKVLALQRQGIRLIFPDVLEIERVLLGKSEI